MAIEEGCQDPARMRLEALIEHCRKRTTRASNKLDSAVLEDAEARAALERARDDLSRWIEDHPDPQPTLI